MVAHVREVEVKIGDGELHVEGGDVLAQEEEVLDHEELRVQCAHLCRRVCVVVVCVLVLQVSMYVR